MINISKLEVIYNPIHHSTNSLLTTFSKAPLQRHFRECHFYKTILMLYQQLTNHFLALGGKTKNKKRMRLNEFFDTIKKEYK